MKPCALFLTLLAAFTMDVRPATAAPQDPAAPGLTFDATAHDFGMIGDEQPVSFSFEFVNTSATQTITVNDVHSSCGCTVAALQKKVYAPGETGQIDVTFNPMGKQGHEQKTITVATDDPGHPQWELTTTSDVVPRIMVEPRSVWLGEVSYDNVVGTIGPKRFQVLARVPGFRITSATIDDKRFTLRSVLTEEVAVGGDPLTRSTYEVSLEQNVPIGRIQTQVTIETNDTLKPKLVVTVLVDAVGSLRVSPDQINAQVQAEHVEFVQEVTLARRDSAGFKILGATVVGPDGKELPGFSATFDMAEPGHPGTWQVRLKGVGPVPGAFAKGTIKLGTDVADQETLDVPFSIGTRPTP